MCYKAPRCSHLTLDARHNGALLNSRGFLKTIGIDSSEEFLTEVHVIEVIHNFIPVALEKKKFN